MPGYDDDFYNDDEHNDWDAGNYRSERRQSSRKAPQRRAHNAPSGYQSSAHARRSPQAAPARRQSADPRAAAGPARQARARRPVQQPQRRKSSPAPFIILGVLIVALLVGGFFLVTSLGKGKTSSSATQEQQTAELSENSAAAAVPQTPTSVTINTLMVGDMLVHHGVWESGEYSTTERNYDHLFAHVLDDLSWADLAMIDQETPLVGPTAFDFSGFPSFNGPLEIADAEAKAGFNMILHASNHAMDQGSDGLRTELSYWRANHPEVQVVGAYMPQEEVAANMGPRYFEKDGFKVAVLNYTYDLNGYEDPYDAVCEIDVAQMQKDVEIAEANADLTIVCPHWGVEDETSPNDEQYELAKLMCDWGVDLVLGNHPHVIQPVQLVVNSAGHTMPVYWSTGNFISTMDQDRNLIGGIAKAVLVKDANGARVSEATFTPIVAHRAYTISSNGINDESSEPSYNADLTTYKLSDYTDALAETNAWRPEDSRPSHSWCVEFCSEVLGSAFDRTSCVLTLSLDPATGLNLGGSSSSSTSSSTSSGSGSDSSMTVVDGGASQTEQLAA